MEEVLVGEVEEAALVEVAVGLVAGLEGVELSEAMEWESRMFFKHISSTLITCYCCTKAHDVSQICQPPEILNTPLSPSKNYI